MQLNSSLNPIDAVFTWVDGKTLRNTVKRQRNIWAIESLCQLHENAIESHRGCVAMKSCTANPIDRNHRRG